jgi:hypothetical protein
MFTGNRNLVMIQSKKRRACSNQQAMRINDVGGHKTCKPTFIENIKFVCWREQWRWWNFTGRQNDA